MAEEKKIIENTAYFSILKYISYFILVIIGLTVTKYLGPADFGIYSAIMLIFSYSRYIFMGFYTACLKKLSYYRGKKQPEKLDDIKDNTFAPSFYITTTIALITFIASYFIQMEDKIITGIRLVAILLPLQHIYYFYQAYLRADKRFTFLGSMELVFNLLKLFFILILIKKYGFVGVILSLIISYVMIIITGNIMRRYRFSLRFDIRKSKDLFLFGLPGTIMSAMGTIFTSIDKLVIIRFFERNSLGLYSFAVLVLEVITFIPANISMVLLPSQIEDFSAGNRQKRIKNLIFMPVLIISYLMPLIIGGAFFFSEPVIRMIFPKYLDILPALHVLISGSFFLSVLIFLENYILSQDKEKEILIPKIIFISLSVLLNIAAVKKGYGLFGIAAATAIIYASYFIYLIIYSFGWFYSTKGIIKHFLEVIFPYAYMILIVFSLNKTALFMYNQDNLHNLLFASCKYTIFLILNIPLWIYIDKKTGILRLALGQIRDKIRHMI